MKHLSKLLITFIGLPLALASCGPSLNPSTPDNSSETSQEKDTTHIIDEGVLLSLQEGTIAINGKYSINGFAYKFKTMFGHAQYYHNEFYWNEKYPEVVIPSGQELNIELDETGQLWGYFTSFDNKEVKVKASGDVNDIINPFYEFKLKDFIYDEASQSYNVINKEAIKIFGNKVTGWGHSEAIDFNIQFNGYDNPCIITSTLANKYDGEITYHMELSFVKDGWPSVIYKTKPEHEELKNLLTIKDKENYTLKVTDTAYSNEENKEVKYDIYRTSDIIYNANDKFGNIKRSDGIFDFVVEDNNIASIYKATTGKINPFAVKPVLDVAPELFRKVSEGRWELINPYLVKEIIPAFALESNLYQLTGMYGTDFILLTDENGIKGYECNYNVESLYSKLHVDIVNIGTTTLPSDIDFETMKTPSTPQENKIPVKWYGTYHGTCLHGVKFNGKNDITMVITKDSIVINDYTMTIIGLDKTRGYKLLAGNATIYLRDQSSDPNKVELVLEDQDMLLMCYNLKKEGVIEPDGPGTVNIPSNWVKTYDMTCKVGTIDGNVNFKLAITTSSVTINGNEVSDLAWHSDEGGYLTFTYNNVAFTISNMDYDGGFKPFFYADDYSITANLSVKQEDK